MLQLAFGVDDHVLVEKFAKFHPAQQFGQQCGVQGQCRRAPFGQRAVALVHERADIAEQQRGGERRRGRRLHLHQPDAALGDACHHLRQRRDVVDVLQALPHRLQHDREVRVFARHVEQLGGALALMPQRGPFAGVAPRQQQRPGRALPEPGGEQRRAAHLGGHQRLDLLGLEHEQLRARRGLVGVGQPHHDAVIARGRLLVDPVTLQQPAADGQRQRAVHLQPVRRVQDHPPVTELVAEPFHQQGGVGGDHGRGLALLAEQPPQVVAGGVVETNCRAAGVELTALHTGELAGELSDCRAQLGWPADVVTAPERQPGRLARGGDDQYPIVGDLGDPPTGGTQGDDVAGP